VRCRPARNHALMHGDARPGDPLHEKHRRVVIEIRAVPAILLDDAEHAGRRRMARDPGRDARTCDGVTIRIKGELLLVDRDDDAEHPLCPGGDVVGGRLRLHRGLLARGHDQAVRPRRGVEGLRPLLVEGKGIRGCEASEQGGARCHGQEALPVMEIGRWARIGPLRFLHEGPPSGAVVARNSCERPIGLRGLVAREAKRFEAAVSRFCAESGIRHHGQGVRT
jgi:hypothetical protein